MECLRACGLNCGHQKVYTHRQTLGEPVAWKLYEGDSSYEAVPLLPTIDDAVKVLLVREPLAVMRSWRALGLFVNKLQTWQGWGLLTRVLDRHAPEVMEHPDPMGRAALFWLRWNQLALPHVDSVWRIEQLTPAGLCKAIERENRYRTGADVVPRNTNHRTGDKWPCGPDSWEDVPADVRDDVYALAKELGYCA